MCTIFRYYYESVHYLKTIINVTKYIRIYFFISIHLFANCEIQPLYQNVPFSIDLFPQLAIIIITMNTRRRIKYSTMKAKYITHLLLFLNVHLNTFTLSKIIRIHYNKKI